MQLGGSGELMGMVARAMYVHVRTAGVRDPIGRGGMHHEVRYSN